MEISPVDTFLNEAEELLAEIEQAALSMSAEGSSQEQVNQLFRAFHTLKGSGSMVGLDDVASFTHHVESLLDRVRSGKVHASEELVEVVLKAKDHLRLLLSAVQSGEGVPAEEGASLIASIRALSEAEPGAPRVSAPVPCSIQAPPTSGRTWRISFYPNPLILARGGNPTALFQELRTLGPCEVVAHTDEVPTLDAIQHDLCYFWWTILLHAPCDENAIRDAFIFVEDGARLDIVAVETVPVQNVSSDVSQQASSPADVKEASPPSNQEVKRERAATRESTIRVPAERLDRLVNLVGELVMNQSRLAQAASRNDAPEFTNPVQELDRLVAELRDNVLGIRMLPIGTIFGRFRRLVHDLAAQLGKEVDLVTEGAETELDKSILDRLGDPLVHCLRNCLDHGVEPPLERIEKGKPRRATIRLSAVHTGADVVISVQDDGRGIDRVAVRAKAIENQLIAPDANLTDKEIYSLILMPGFSTAREVTDVSGRGVGMDAIKGQIDALRGSLALSSRDGAGTRLCITLPLTLAIIDGLLVQIAEDQFIVPMAAVTENVELAKSERMLKNGRNVIAVRGELIPYIDLRATFDIGGTPPGIEKVIIVQHEDDRVGMVVDRVIGSHQTVIQSLGKFYRNIKVVSGATIMGDGRVALILDIAAVVRLANQTCQPTAVAA